ncbi:GNAT family N-acetyltransferase [Streptomyces sp. NPDC087294]|uniref:GNAT family N-acetyltransferase n=1 Tax=Streptomyces sp. NPDC087294 TaxID=3365777 RepID=UPI003813C7BA
MHSYEPRNTHFDDPRAVPAGTPRVTPSDEPHATQPPPDPPPDDGWNVTHDVEAFLDRTGDFLHSQPAVHTVQLTVTERLRTRGADTYGSEVPFLGWLEEGDDIHATYLRTPPHPLVLSPLTTAQADTLAARLAALGHQLPGVDADHATATAFAEAWQRHTGVASTLRRRHRLYRLGTLTPPSPCPAGRARRVDAADRGQLTSWYSEFMNAVGEGPVTDAASLADLGISRGLVTFWETPEGAAVSMAGVTPLVAGQIRVTTVYTPAHLRGRGYAGAVTAEVSRAALAAGAQEVLLFADLSNSTSNGLYQRLGYTPVEDFAAYDFEAG